MVVSQFFVLNNRGDSVISRFYRNDVVANTPEIFFRHLKSGSDLAPIMSIDGVNYFHINRQKMYFCITTRTNDSPMMILEFLNRVTKVFKDYCGVLTEEALQLNFVLLNELLDEMIDFGHIQGTSTELLKQYVYMEPVAVTVAGGTGPMAIQTLEKKVLPGSAANKPIQLMGKVGSLSGKAAGNEIFVDLVEKLTVLFSANGNILRSEIDGFLQMKSFLTGNPELHLFLNEKLHIGHDTGSATYGAVVLDDANFHDCVRLSEWESDRALVLYPPDGEFTLMNYRVARTDFTPPFRVFPLIESVSIPNRVDVLVKVRADFPDNITAATVTVQIPVPKITISSSNEITGVTGSTSELKTSDGAKHVKWEMKKLQGGSEAIIRCKLVLQGPVTDAAKKEISHVSLDFEIPMYSPSGVTIRALRVIDRGKNYFPYRWVRCLCVSQSYVVRV